MSTLDTVLAHAELPADAVEVGRIAEAWGIKGQFKVHPYSNDPQALLRAQSWFIQPGTRGARLFAGTRLLEVEQVRAHGSSVVAAAKGVHDRDTAELLCGAGVFVSRSDFPRAQEDEYYWVDLIGLDVFNRESVHLGCVRDLLSSGAQTVLVIEALLADGKKLERMIPFVAAHVDSVDLQARRIIVNWQPDY